MIPGSRRCASQARLWEGSEDGVAGTGSIQLRLFAACAGGYGLPPWPLGFFYVLEELGKAAWECDDDDDV